MLSEFPIHLRVPCMHGAMRSSMTSSVKLAAFRTRGGSAGIQILYTYVTSSSGIRYDNRSYAVVVQRKSCARRQISAPYVSSCIHVNDLSFNMCISGGQGSTQLSRPLLLFPSAVA